MRSTPRAIAIGLILVVPLVPGAAAHIDYCTHDVCIYEWSWSWGSGSCTQGRDHWWSDRFARASFEHDGVKREAALHTSCDAYAFQSGDVESSSIHFTLTTTDRASGEQSWVWLDWYGTDSPSGSTCTIRLWSYNEEYLPTGTVTEPCPARPPFLMFA